MGVHSITASVTDSGGMDGSDQITITVNAPPNTMHVGNLQGNTMTVGKKKWKASVIITVNASDETPVSDATVNGTWSGSISYTDSCITDVSGQCEITSRPMLLSDPAITFTADSVSHLTLGYQPEDNSISSIQIACPY